MQPKVIDYQAPSPQILLPKLDNSNVVNMIGGQISINNGIAVKDSNVDELAFANMINS